MRFYFGLVAVLSFAGCMTIVPDTQAPHEPSPVAASAVSSVAFSSVVARMLPVAKNMCRKTAPGANCNFQIVVDTRKSQPANAYQTIDKFDRPVIGFTAALIHKAKNQDELAFILGHEAAHHISGHLAKTQESAMTGALLGTVLATIAGGDADTVERAQDVGANAGARRFSKNYELQADAMGTRIAFQAGYDPILGAKYFNRIRDPGDKFLGSHPPNAQRIKVVHATMAKLR
ncbi:MAG: M48 family metallopeptidase [Marinosulfonomonas sp.]|nr:M48 family metallopeptidase [Marinosulfonomonas sp.]